MFFFRLEKFKFFVLKMADFASHHLSKFNGKNYQIWKFQIRSILRSHGVLCIVEGKKTRSVEDPAKKDDSIGEKIMAWEKEDGKAMSIITSTMDNDQVENVITCNSAKEVWDKLSSLHEQKSESSKIVLMQRFLDCKMDSNESVTKYVTRLENMVRVLKDVGENVSDVSLMAKILGGLTSKYNAFISAWDSVESSKQTIELLQERLIKEEGRMDIKEEETSALVASHNNYNNKSSYENKSSYGKERNFNYKKNKSNNNKENKYKDAECYYCHKTGHIAKDCRKKKAARKKYQEENEKKFDVEESNFVDALVAEVNSSIQQKERGDEDDEWLLDSGASRHISHRRDWFMHLLPSRGGKIVLGDAGECPVEGIGSIMVRKLINNNWVQGRIDNVLFVPGIKKNLLSVGVLVSRGFTVNFEHDKSVVIRRENKIIAKGVMLVNNVYRLLLKVEVPEIQINVATTSARIWHERFGHINSTRITDMARTGAVIGLKTSSEQIDCEACKLAKTHRLPYKRIEERIATRPGELFHTDVCGPMRESSLGGARYYLLFRDDATDFRFVYFLKYKSDVLEKFRQFEKEIFNKFNRRMVAIRSDKGGEFLNKKFHDFLAFKGIKHQTTAGYAPEMNGRAERDNRTIIEDVRAVMNAAGFPRNLWSETVNAVVYLLNCATNSSDTRTTPYEKWIGRKPSVSHLRILGSISYAHIPKQFRGKLDMKAKETVLVGYRPETKIYRLYDIKNRKIIEAHDAVFSENKRYNFQNSKIENVVIRVELDKEAEPTVNDGGNHDELVEYPGTFDDSVYDDAFDSGSEPEPENHCKTQSQQIPPEPANDTGPNLRNRETLKKPLRYQVNSTEVKEPASYKEAVSGPQQEKWIPAIKKELIAHDTNNTWSIVQRPPNCKLIDSKWVFKIQAEKCGELNVYKARLCARGFYQTYGIDFEETFSPVIRYDTLRLMLALAARENYQMCQFDVKTAFLHGKLNEDVYMRVPEGLLLPKNVNRNGLALKLNKALYGLKQSARCWYKTMSDFMTSIGFKVCESDKSLYVCNKYVDIIYVLVFIDDGLIMCKNTNLIKNVLSKLKSKFEIVVTKPNVFVGVEITRSFKTKKIFINQKTYAMNVIKRFGMESAKPVSTPIECNINLMNAKKCDESIPYREIIGSLMFLASVSRPDIAYSVNYLSRFLNAYDRTHWNAAKRVLSYVSGTINYGILYDGNGKYGNVVGYSDSDFAGDILTRRSTSGFLFMLSYGPISWFSQRQRMVTLSTTESEYVAASEATKEAIWFISLMSEIGHSCASAINLFIDNQSAIRLIKNPEFHKRTKHIDVRFHFIRERQENGEISVKYVKSSEQLADIFTKGLTRVIFEYLRKYIVKSFSST